jgi:PAS domain-containing protein
MLVKLAFSETSDERFLVTAEFFGSTTPGQCSHFTVTPYQDENAFLEAVVFADLPQDTMVHVTTAVLRSIESPGPLRWISVDLSARAQQVLGVAREGEQTSVRTSPLQMTEEFVSRLADVPGLEEVLLRSPTPFAISLGREHEIAFLNDAYAHLLGRSSSEGLVGKLVVEAMPELRDQPCVQLLDEVYRTGEPKVGIELKGKPRVDAPEEWREEYHELNYHPVRNYGGMVCGVMVQATDVTEKVLDRQVSASREAQLYWQWAELENIYRAAPMAICNFDAKEYRILRMNDLQAETMGAPAESLIGKRVLDIFPAMVGLPAILARAASGESIQNLVFTTDFPIAPGVLRSWLLNYSPIYDWDGKVEMITSMALEITGHEGLGTRGNVRGEELEVIADEALSER